MSGDDVDRARLVAVATARASYGRLLAWLARQWRDIAAAEDALADAFLAALEHWPRDGVPASPEGWLMTAARRNLLKAARHRRQAEDPALSVLYAGEEEAWTGPAVLPDDRLRLMFVCAHPAIDAGVRSALMLQTVLGIESGRIAGAFLVSPEAMSKRLVRAKAKIKATGMRFEEPDADDLPPRVDVVLQAIYGAYVLHWGHAESDPPEDLAEESVFLAELVATQQPGHAEALGLQALLLFCEARKPARLQGSDFVALDAQDASRWNRSLIQRANDILARAATLRDPGAFQLEAAIQAAHCHRLHAGRTPWSDIVHLYERLIDLHPTTGARIGHAMALAKTTGNSDKSLRLMDLIDARSVTTHQPWWAARAHLLREAGHRAAAAEAFEAALALTKEPALQRYLAAQLAAVRAA